MSFKDIKGQDRPIEILKDHLRQGRLAKAYLFTGPEGVGKKLAAVALAKTVNCRTEDAFDSCDNCPSCLKIDKGQHPDVHIIDAAGADIKIEYIRQLQNVINLRAYEARKKVFIINDAHNLNTASSNAFLKTLEESAGENLIILITEKPSLLLKTISSRCQVIKFPSLKREEVMDILALDHSIPPELSHYLAYFYEGRLGSALRHRDADILGQKNKAIDEFALKSRLGPGNAAADKREDLREGLNILASWFRDICMLKIGMPHSELINLDRKTELLRQVPRFSFSDLDNIFNSISHFLLYLERNVNYKLIQSNLKVELWKD